MAINIGGLFSYGLEATGEALTERDANVKASAQASAEAFAEKREKYDDEITVNRNMLKKNADAIRNSLGINDVGKIRTIISTYGAEDTMVELQKDFAKYQTAAAYDQNDGKFKTLSEYVKGRISGTSNTFLNDAEAEQATDEAAVIGDKLDIQKAKKRAKAEGITIEQYLDNKSRSMTNRPAFDIDTRAAKLVRESKMGLFGGELTLEEAKSKIMGDRTMGEDAKDLGETGFALAREGGLSAEQTSKIGDRITAKQLKRGDVVSNSELASVKNQIAKELNNDVKKNIVKNNGNGSFTLLDNETAIAAAIKNIDLKLQEKSLDQKSKSVLEKLKDEYERRITNTSSKEEDNKKNEVVLKDGRIIKKEGDNFVFDKKPSISSLEQLLKDSKPGARIRINGKNYILKTFLDSIKKQKQKKIDEGQLKKKSNPFLGLS